MSHSCDHLTGLRRCGSLVIDKAVRVPVRYRGVTTVCLCHKHSAASDTTLQMIAGFMLSTGPGQRDIEAGDIAPGLIVAHRATGGLARVVRAGPSALIELPNGRRVGMNYTDLSKLFHIPGKTPIVTV